MRSSLCFQGCTVEGMWVLVLMLGKKPIAYLLCSVYAVGRMRIILLKESRQSTLLSLVWRKRWPGNDFHVTGIDSWRLRVHWLTDWLDLHDPFPLSKCRSSTGRYMYCTWMLYRSIVLLLAWCAAWRALREGRVFCSQCHNRNWWTSLIWQEDDFGAAPRDWQRFATQICYVSGM